MSSIGPLRYRSAPARPARRGRAGGRRRLRGHRRALDVDATFVRLAFALLAFASGAGIVAYIGAWALLPAPSDSPPRRGAAHPRRGAARLGGDSRAARARPSDSLVWPLALVAAGAVLLSGATFGLEEKRARVAALSLVVIGIVIFVGENTRGTATTLLAPGAVASR